MKAGVPEYHRQFGGGGGLNYGRLAEAGPQGAVFGFLRRAGQELMDAGLEAQARQAVTEQTAAGLAGGQEAGRASAQALAEGRTPDMPIAADGSTISGQAYNKAMFTAYLSRLDVTAEEMAVKISADHPTDPAAFRKRWDAVQQQLVQSVPPEYQPQALQEFSRKGLRYLHPIAVAQQKQELASANAQMLRDSDLFSTRAANAWRADSRAEAGEFTDKWLKVLDARTDLDPMEKEQARLQFGHNMSRHAALGAFDRVKARGLGAAARFIAEFENPATHPDLSPDLKAKVANEMRADLSELKAQQRAAMADLRLEAQDLTARIHAGYDADLSGVIKRARALGDSQTAGHLQTLQANQDFASSFRRLSLPDQKAAMALADQRAKAGTDAASAQQAVLARRMFEANVQGIHQDPYAWAAERGEAVPQIDWAKPETITARIRFADGLSAKHGVPVPPLSTHEVQGLADSIKAAPLDQQAALLGSLSKGAGQRLPQLLSQIKDHAPEAANAAVISAQGAPGLARELLQGAKVRRELKGEYLPSKDETLKLALDQAMPHDLFANIDPADQRAVTESVLSLYAARSYAVGAKIQSTLDSKRLRQAVHDVVGGVVEHKGRPLLAPVRGMGQDGFDNLLGSLTEADLQGARAATGAPVTRAQIRDHARLESLGGGRYLVNIADGYVQGANGRALVLDLGSVASRLSVERAAGSKAVSDLKKWTE